LSILPCNRLISCSHNPCFSMIPPPSNP
jgi:hypothetical protein